jgi:hypothetical protein
MLLLKSMLDKWGAVQISAEILSLMTYLFRFLDYDIENRYQNNRTITICQEKSLGLFCGFFMVGF